jgi:voltage-gated potassium channel
VRRPLSISGSKPRAASSSPNRSFTYSRHLAPGAEDSGTWRTRLSWAGILATGFAEETRRREFLRTWDLVAMVPFFHDIAAALIADVARLLRPREFPAGAIIVRRGQLGYCMYFVVSGEVGVQLQPEEVLLGPGAFFGEMSLLPGSPRNVTIVTTQPCALLALDIVDFRELLRRQPNLARIIHEGADRRLAAG